MYIFPRCGPNMSNMLRSRVDGKVYATIVDDQDKFRTKSMDDILLMFQNAVEEGYIDEEEADAPTQPPGVTAEPLGDVSASMLG